MIGVGQAARKLGSVPVARILLAAPVLYELRRGAALPGAPKALKRIVEQITSLYEVAVLDGAAAEAAAAIAVGMRARGQQIHHLDTLIAGIALSRGATLVSRDRVFSGVKDLDTESWT
jgi:predicted nucleic acid-binding protein